MEIINEREDINLDKWMEKAKDYYDFVTWDYMCAWS
jgi:hypothetical protein